MRKSTKIILICLSVCVIAILGLYLGVAVYFNSHFLPGSVVNGIDCANKTAEEVEKLIAAKVQDYSITLTELGGGQETIAGSQIGFEYVSDGSVERLQDGQSSILWLKAYFKPENYTMTANTTYNKDMLKSVMQSLGCFDPNRVIKPQDAHIQETDGSYNLIPEVEGNELDENKVFELLTQAVDNGDRSLDLAALGCYKKPAVYSDDAGLNARFQTLQKYSRMSVTYDMGNQQEVLDSAAIRSWMTVAEDGSVSFDRDSAASYVASLAEQYDTFGTYEPFTTSLGEYIEVQSRTYGWQIDQEGETAALMEVLQAGEPVTREPLYLETARSRGENDLGDTYVEIDYTNQRMWYYQDGQLMVDTPIVTGNVSADMASPEGIFCLAGKEENATLVGEGYRTPVDYWMPFYDGVGIHDANTWRNAYGGDIYLTNGSHGCINTPTDKAAVIFANIEVGTPIVCYSSSTKLGDNTISVGQPSAEQTGDNGAAGGSDSQNDPGAEGQESGQDNSQESGEDNGQDNSWQEPADPGQSDGEGVQSDQEYTGAEGQ